MKLGMQVGLGPGHIVLDGDPALLLRAHVCNGLMAALIKIPLGMEVDLGPGDFVLDGDPAPRPQKGGGDPLPIFGPCALWPNGCMHGSRRHLAWRWALVQATLC